MPQMRDNKEPTWSQHGTQMDPQMVPGGAILDEFCPQDPPQTWKLVSGKGVRVLTILMYHHLAHCIEKVTEQPAKASSPGITAPNPHSHNCRCRLYPLHAGCASIPIFIIVSIIIIIIIIMQMSIVGWNIVSWSSLIQDVVALRLRAGKLGVGRAELQRCKIIPPIEGEESLSVRVYKASCKRGGART